MQSVLVKQVRDDRRGDAPICVFAPVGDATQLDVFLKQVKRLGLDMCLDMCEVDFLFIFKNIADVKETGLSALCVVETCPIGTSGCFFVGQTILYQEGYSVIISTDLDAELDSAETFHSIALLANQKNVAVFTRSIFNENTSKQLAYNVNDWAAFPREFFEEVGFSTPYMWRGGEEYELLTRLLKTNRNKFIVHSGGYTHPFVGFSIYHKMTERKKYCPYVSGILRAILFVSEYDITALPKFVAWYVFYGFFADLLDDTSLKQALQTSGRFELLRNVENAHLWFKIEKIRESGHFSNTSFTRVAYLPTSLISLALTGSCNLYTDRITLLKSKKQFILGLVKATLMIPVRTIKSVVRIYQWKRERKKVIFPVKPKDVETVESIYRNLVCQTRL